MSDDELIRYLKDVEARAEKERRHARVEAMIEKDMAEFQRERDEEYEDARQAEVLGALNAIRDVLEAPARAAAEAARQEQVRAQIKAIVSHTGATVRSLEAAKNATLAQAVLVWRRVNQARTSVTNADPGNVAADRVLLDLEDRVDVIVERLAETESAANYVGVGEKLLECALELVDTGIPGCSPEWSPSFPNVHAITLEHLQERVSERRAAIARLARGARELEEALSEALDHKIVVFNPDLSLSFEPWFFELAEERLPSVNEVNATLGRRILDVPALCEPMEDFKSPEGTAAWIETESRRAIEPFAPLAAEIDVQISMIAALRKPWPLFRPEREFIARPMHFSPWYVLAPTALTLLRNTILCIVGTFVFVSLWKDTTVATWLSIPFGPYGSWQWYHLVREQQARETLATLQVMQTEIQKVLAA